MFRLRFERHIERSIEDVFARLIDIDGYEDWLPRSMVFKGGDFKDPDDGTRAIHEAEGEVFGPTRFTEPLLRLFASNERRRTVDELKRSLEA